MDLIFATHNNNKINEAKNILKDVNIISLKDLSDYDQVEEVGATFSENAFLKANHFYKKYHKATIADDSGLVVLSLGGAPGITSARYAGNNCDYSKNNQYLLENMKGIIDRQAYFITVICYIDSNGLVIDRFVRYLTVHY